MTIVDRTEITPEERGREFPTVGLVFLAILAALAWCGFYFHLGDEIFRTARTIQIHGSEVDSALAEARIVPESVAFLGPSVAEPRSELAKTAAYQLGMLHDYFVAKQAAATECTGSTDASSTNSPGLGWWLNSACRSLYGLYQSSTPTWPKDGIESSSNSVPQYVELQRLDRSASTLEAAAKAALGQVHTHEDQALFDEAFQKALVRILVDGDSAESRKIMDVLSAELKVRQTTPPRPQ